MNPGKGAEIGKLSLRLLSLKVFPGIHEGLL